MNLGMDLLPCLRCSEVERNSSLVTLFLLFFFGSHPCHGTDAQRGLSMVGTPRGAQMGLVVSGPQDTLGLRTSASLLVLLDFIRP